MGVADLSTLRNTIRFILDGEIIEIADLVTEMTMIKHPFRAGVKAQLGIEF